MGPTKRLARLGQKTRRDQSATDVRVADGLNSGPPLGPLDRLHQVVLEIAELSDELQDTGLETRNLRHWSIELTSIRAEIEQKYRPA
jgi:hypothetical protein